MVNFKDVREMAQSFIFLAVFLAIGLFVIGYLSGELTSLAQSSNINLSSTVTQALEGIANAVGSVGGTIVTVSGVVIIIIMLLMVVEVLRERFKKE